MLEEVQMEQLSDGVAAVDDEARVSSAGNGSSSSQKNGSRSSSGAGTGAALWGGYPLAMARTGEHLTICAMHGGHRYRRKLMDMGLRPGVNIDVLRSGGQGPVLILTGGTRLGIGRGMAEKIEVAPVAASSSRA